jgi:hypothetical protein
MKDHQRKPYEISGSVNFGTLSLNKYKFIYKKYGVIIFRNFFYKDKIFCKFYEELKSLALIIAKKNKIKVSADLNLDELITEISKTHRKEIGKLYDLGTRPIKLLSGIQLKIHPGILKILKGISDYKNIIANPYLGETLHIFPPGKENFQYNLPMHQDYPYLMQSPDQITAYINLGKLVLFGNGGIRAWLGSHKFGISDIKKNKLKLFETKNSGYFKKKYLAQEFYFEKGDLAIFNSLMQHEGIQNHSTSTRIVQLVRYSNLLNKDSISYYWQSKEEDKKRKSTCFKDIHF